MQPPCDILQQSIRTLPTIENARKALESMHQNSNPWRSLVLDAIEYATSTIPPNGSSSVNPGEQDPPEEVMEQRVQETVLFLFHALDDWNSSPNEQTEQPNSTKTAPERGLLDAAQETVVDALWLMGTLLRPQGEGPLEEKVSRGGTPATAPSNTAPVSYGYKSLCRLTRAVILQPRDSKAAPILQSKSMASMEPQLLLDSTIFSPQILDLFVKKIRKLNTDTYYRQKKVNLLQEESEGYAKFLRMLTNLPLVHHHNYDRDDALGFELESSVEKACSSCSLLELSQMLKLNTAELIGTFDLDPNRCLDLTIDAVESELRQVLISRNSASNFSLYTVLRDAKGHALTIRLLMELIHLFPKDNIPHLIGFKLSSYRSNGVNESQSETPSSLYLVTALLASHGLLSLAALQPHLPPWTDIERGYELWKDIYVKKIKRMGVVSLNSSKHKSDEIQEQENLVIVQSMGKDNQCIQLFDCLMDVGFDVRAASQIFDDNSQQVGHNDETKVKDWVMKCCCVYPPLGSKLCKLLENAIEPLMEAKVANVGSKLCLEKDNEEGQVHTVDKDSSLLPVDWTNRDNLEWSTNLSLEELCSKMDILVDPIVMSGSMAANPILYCKLCRLVRAMLWEVSSDTEITNVAESVLEFIERVLVAPLSLFPYNPAIASELWSVLSIFSFHLRYALYATWRKHGLEKAALRSTLQPSKPLAQIESEVSTAISTKYLLKRMSKENMKDMGKQVSKIAHNNPLVVFTLMLNQIESYDNLILMMVDTFKFMSVLSLDVMGYCLLVSLGGEGEKRTKMKDDGVNTAQWLSSLETFTGAFYKRFPDVEMRGLLAYFTRRLHDGHTLELGVLQSLVKMAGGYGFMDCESTASLSDAQLEGRCGSLTLRRETSDFGIVEKINMHSSRQLRKSLQDGGRGVVFLILLSQIRTKILFQDSHDSPKQIKLIGNLYDKCHRTMNLLLAFLTNGSQDVDVDSLMEGAGDIPKYGEYIPSLNDMMTKFSIGNQDVWALSRPLVRASLLTEEKTSSDDTHMIPSYLQSYSSTILESSLDPAIIPKETWNHLTQLLFARFYSYAIYDLACPTDTYENEIARLKREIDRLEMLQKGGRDALGIQASMASAAAAAGGTQRDIREATAFTKEHAAELDRLKRTSDILATDMERQKRHVEQVINRLKSEKNRLFSNATKPSSETASVFFSTCIYPRCLYSPEDAIYCARFIKLLHDIETPGFPTLHLLNVIVNAAVGALYSITEDEAGCFGIFMNEIWKMTSSWRYDELAYEKNVIHKPGGISKTVTQSDDEKDTPQHMPHSEFIHEFNAWHAGLGVAFIGCLQSSEYMHTRTALIVLSKVVDYFPSKSTLGEKLLKSLAPLQADNNPMQDIKAMAQGYASKLIKTRDTGKWMEEDQNATKAREEKERKQQLHRKKNAEKQLQELAKDMEDSQRRMGESSTSHRSEPNSNNPPDRRGGRVAPLFTPPTTATNTGSGAGTSIASGGESGGTKPTEPSRSSRPLSSQPLSSSTTSTTTTAPTSTTSARDSSRSHTGSRYSTSTNTRRDDSRPSPPSDRRTGPSAERWERPGPDMAHGKRGRSPTSSDQGGGRGSDRGRDDAKRVRRDMSPPRRGSRRSGRRT